MIYEPTIVLRPDMIYIDDTARIDSFCKIEGGEGVYIGKNVHIASYSHINIGGGRTTFGDHSGCASGCKVVSASPNLSYRHISPLEDPELVHTIRKHTIIGPYAILFCNVVILPGVRIGVGAVVGAGAVVAQDVEDWTVVVGAPARRIGIRSVLSQLPLPFVDGIGWEVVNDLLEGVSIQF